jgi:beta-ribofuranosylaminobenzene 5'-phosphate synthase
MIVAAPVNPNARLLLTALRIKKMFPSINRRRVVVVEAPCRLHFGFMDLSETAERCYGSLGLTLEGLATRLRAEPADDLSASGPQGERALGSLRLLAQQLPLPGGVQLTVETAIPEHVGLGSGTQLALAVGTAVARLYDLDLSPREIARLLDRGARSGIGVGAFEQGGFIVDGGRRGEAPPPVVSRVPFPEAWRVILIFDRGARGLHGPEEVEAFRRLPPFSEEAAGRLCRLVLLKALPALIEADVASFGAAVSELQRVVGDHFAPAQGGRFASPRVAQALAWLEAQGVAGVGQSSWGPTGFAVVGTEVEALALVRALEVRWGDGGPLSFRVCRARNQGAAWSVEEAQRPGLQTALRMARR